MKLKSNENWDAGLMCLETGRLNAAANRLYYAVFQAVYTWAVSTQKYKSKGFGGHADMRNFVRATGAGRTLYGDVYEDLMALRNKADYDKETPEKSEIESLIENSNKIRENFLKKAENAV